MMGGQAFHGFLREAASSRRRRIGIGLVRPEEAVLVSIRRAVDWCDIVTFGGGAEPDGALPDGLEAGMAAALAGGDLDALVRGQADSERLRTELASRIGFDAGGVRDLALMLDHRDRILAVCPVAHRQGWTVPEKALLVRDAAALLGLLRLPVKVGITSGVRPDSLGACPILDRTFTDAEELVSLLQGEFPVRHYFIDLDKAADDGCTILVPQNGMVGNQVLRALAFLGGVKVYGGVVAGTDRTVLEAFRNASGFEDTLLFAAALANLKPPPERSNR